MGSPTPPETCCERLAPRAAGQCNFTVLAIFGRGRMGRRTDNRFLRLRLPPDLHSSPELLAFGFWPGTRRPAVRKVKLPGRQSLQCNCYMAAGGNNSFHRLPAVIVGHLTIVILYFCTPSLGSKSLVYPGDALEPLKPSTT
jgi:hypothetical protein